MPHLPQKKVSVCQDLPEGLDVCHIYISHCKIGLINANPHRTVHNCDLQAALWHKIITKCALFKCDMEVEKRRGFIDGTSEATEGGYC